MQIVNEGTGVGRVWRVPRGRTRFGCGLREPQGIPCCVSHSSPKTGLDPDFLPRCARRSACAPFIKERRMKCINATGLRRKSGQMGHANLCCRCKIAMDARPGGPTTKREPSPGGLGIYGASFRTQDLSWKCFSTEFKRARATLRRPDLRRITVSKVLYSLLRSGGENAVRSFYRLTLSGLGFLLILAAALGQRSVASTDKPAAIGTGNLELGQRKELPSEAVSAEGLIRLDATVTDQAGKPVAGLQRTDFRLLDNSQPQRIIAFHASKDPSASAEDSLTVIILLDTLDLPSYLAALERQQVAQFLRYKSGKLAQPVTIYSLEDSGFFLTAKSSTDGEALATDVTSETKVEAYFLAPKVHSPLKAVVEPSFDTIPALTGLRALWTIAAAEASRPGRKLLFWIGPGLGNRGTGAFASDGTGLLGHFPPGTLLITLLVRRVKK